MKYKNFLIVRLNITLRRLNPIRKWQENIIWMLIQYQDTAFGIIIGCIYSSFLQTYTNQSSTPSSQDVEEFTKIIIENSKKIKESIMLEDNPKLKQE